MQPKINKGLREIFSFRINHVDKWWQTSPGWGVIERTADPPSADTQFSALMLQPAASHGNE